MNAATITPELQSIIGWRTEQLLAAGYGPSEAIELAENFQVDLHQAVELAERGCSPELAVDILT